MNREYFNEVRNKLEMGGTVNSNELLLYLMFNIENVLYEEESKLLELTALEVLENPSSFIYKSSTIRFHEEGYEKLEKQYKDFLNKAEEVLVEQNEKTFESQMFRYESEKSFWEEHLKVTEEAIEKLMKIEEITGVDFGATLKELNGRKERHIERLDKIEKPVKLTTEEYKGNLIDQYEKAISNYKLNMEREKNISIEDKNNLVQEIFNLIK